MLDLRINFAFFVAGRIIFELFADICPKTSDNFRALCTGREVRINVDICTTTATTNYYINININPFAPEPPVTARADPGPFYPL